MRGKLAVVDTNVLLTATNRARSGHETARSLFRAARGAGCRLAVCGQILREYVAVATRPVRVNGLGLQHADALRNVGRFREQAVFLDETEAVFDELERLTRRYGSSGKRIHDANIAAVTVAHGAQTIITANTQDFTGIAELDVLSPEEAERAFGESGG